MNLEICTRKEVFIIHNLKFIFLKSFNKQESDDMAKISAKSLTYKVAIR